MKMLRVRSQKAFGLLETAVAMIVITAVMTGAVMMYGSNMTKMTVSAIEADMHDLHHAIERLYAARPGYDGLTESGLAASGALPSSMVNGDSIIPSSRQLFHLYTNSAGCTWGSDCIGRYGLKFFGLSPEVCKQLAYLEWPGKPSSVSVGATETEFLAPYDRDVMADQCNDTNSNRNTAFRIFYRR